MSSKRKILIVLYYYYPYVSGVSVYAKRLAEGLVNRGYNVTVLTSRHDKSLPLREGINGVQVIRKRVLLRVGKGVIIPAFLPSILKHGISSDFINMHLPMTEVGLITPLIPNKKIITTYHCDIYLGDSVLDRVVVKISLAIMRLQLSCTRKIVANSSDYMKSSQMSDFINKVVPVYPPIPAPKKVTDSKLLFDKLRIEDDVIRIGFMGRLVYEKGVGYLLDAIPRLKNSLPDFKIIIAGDHTTIAGGSIKPQLDKYLKKYPETIMFTGYLTDDNRDRFYAGLDVLVLPSIDPLESFGMVQVEAMLQGAPVVASDMPGVREVIKKTGYGRLCKIKNSLDLAKQIVEVVKNKAHYKPDRNKVLKVFSDRETVDAYANLFR